MNINWCKVGIVLGLFLGFVGEVGAEEIFEDNSYVLKQNSLPNLIAKPMAESLSTGVGNSKIQLVFAVEKQTASKYPDIENQIKKVVDELNRRVSFVGISRDFSLLRFNPVFDKNVDSGCRQISQNSIFAPKEFCGHGEDYVLVVVDEVGAVNYTSGNFKAVEWHGYNGLFGSQGYSVLIHEMGHIMGLPDLYLLKLDSKNNYVNGVQYNQPYYGFIMNNLTPGNFHEYDKQIVNKIPPGVPAPFYTWANYQTTNNLFIFKDKYDCPVGGAEVKIFETKQVGNHMELPNTVKFEGKTNEAGEFVVNQKLLGGDVATAVKMFLIKVALGDKSFYRMINFTDVNFAYWDNGATKSRFEIEADFDVCVPSPTPSIDKGVMRLLGDADGNWVVDMGDMAVWKLEYLSGGTNSDFDQNGKVDMTDLGIWKTEYLK